MICVLLSTYNGEKYLEEQLESLRKQEDVDIIILLRDDGSNDSTVKIIERWRSKYPALVDFVKGKNVGFALSFTLLLQMAVEKYPCVEYFAFCDQDDVWKPEKLRKAVEKLKNERTDIPVMYCSNTTIVDENLQFKRFGWKKDDVVISKEKCLIRNFATGCTMVFNLMAAKIYVSHIPEVVRVHDYTMFQQCVFLGKVIYDDNSYILYRQHGNNQIGSRGLIQRMKSRCLGHYKERRLEYQNYRFLKAYKDLLSVDDIGIISQIVFYRRNLFSRLSLLFNLKIRYNNFEDNFFYVLKLFIKGGGI